MTDRALYVAMTGASASLRAQASVSHNLANTDTVGFQATMSGTVAAPIDGEGHRTRVNAGFQNLGVSGARGHIMTTGNPLDVALHADRWLAVQATDGTTAYTRAGNLQVTPNGLLTTRSGLPVLGPDGAPVAIPPNDSMSIASDGTISVVPQGQPAATIATAGTIGVFQATQSQLVRGDDGLFRPAPDVQPALATGASMTPGALEGSNVEATTALVSMIELSRHFEMQVRVLQTSDENARSANSLLSSR
ncbi:flagellar basal body rod protein FlgF [Cognatilysobacter bugurensis]|uniref:Flagellar basal-body rod protein FlgF n=1 Tax=Cognatilysobacter bugurensis TaxID=543356 RepID=A0A918T3N8_9GAMM|nr:flagellar basal body rod protein FlgF [Lysobacter bugurensis]GHA89341.1 flagellar basal-body rod protein FlgF [Lysobacter bugurensis]